VAWYGFRGGAAATRGNNDHFAEECTDQMCPRLPCRTFWAGYRKGYDRGWEEGYAAGYGAGYSAGYGAGYSAGVATCSG
jgi:hypothetical protein